jgi:hypothetical protein
MTWKPTTHVVSLNGADGAAVNSLLREVLAGADSVDITEVMSSIAIYAQELPRWLRRELLEFKSRQAHHLLAVELKPFNPDDLRPTPARYRQSGQIELADRYDVLHLMFASLLGQPFAWSSIQDGYVINDVMPISTNRDLPVSSGSALDFGLHSEDAFQRWAGDYLGLFCLRNPDQVPTRFSGFETAELSDTTRRVLFEPRFIVGANIAHAVNEITTPSPILFGAEKEPYLRINLNATFAQSGDEEAAKALASLATTLARNVAPVAFKPGQFWYIDNLRVVHGRDSFVPRFDGTDRWFRRLYISSAFRYSRHLRDHTYDTTLTPSIRGWSDRP